MRQVILDMQFAQRVQEADDIFSAFYALMIGSIKFLAASFLKTLPAVEENGDV